MNHRLVFRYLGYFVLSMVLWLALSSLWCFWYREWAALAAFGKSILATVALGAGLVLLGLRAPKRMYERESIALVGLGWLITAGVGALPFWFAGMMPFADAYFESMSGFTTTGSSVIPVLEPVAKSILFWRALTHWLGGLGIVLLIVAILPIIGIRGKMLCRSEATGIDKDGLRPRIKDTAVTLYKIYTGLTVIQITLLMAAGMDFFDASCHTFAALATGGFSTRTMSVAAYDSVPIEIIINVFQLLGATNFALYYAMAKGNWRSMFRDTEWRVFMGIYACTVLMVTLNLLGAQGAVAVDTSTPGAMGAFDYSAPQALRHASFEVSTMMTNTGFFSADMNLWPYFSRILILVVVMMGGCAGSTAGGMKIIRVIILFKIATQQLKRTFRPHTIHAIRVDGKIISEDVQYSVLSFFLVYVSFFTFATLVMSLLGLPLQTAFSSVVACLNNTGPGLELVGPVANFQFIPAVGKYFLSLVMVTGRLEFFSILVFFLPSFWKRG